MEYSEPGMKGKLLLSENKLPGLLQNRDGFFKLIWNRGERLTLSTRSVEIPLNKNQIASMTPLQEVQITEDNNRVFTALYFNREFYCIHENDREVSCEGLLFFGSSQLPVLKLPNREEDSFNTLFNVFRDEMQTKDSIQGEMLRMLLKRLIIKCTRLARQQLMPEDMEQSQADLIRKFNILVEQNYRSLHTVKEYADRLNRAPKTLSNLFARAGHKTPLEVIHERIAMEARKLLLKTDRLSKEIAWELGFEDQSHFSRFFKKETGLSPTAFRKGRKIPKREKLTNIKE